MFHSCRTDSRQNNATKTSAVSTLDWSIEHLAAWLAVGSEASLKAALFPESTEVIYGVSEEEEAHCNRGERKHGRTGERKGPALAANENWWQISISHSGNRGFTLGQTRGDRDNNINLGFRVILGALV